MKKSLKIIFIPTIVFIIIFVLIGIINYPYVKENQKYIEAAKNTINIRDQIKIDYSNFEKAGVGEVGYFGIIDANRKVLFKIKYKKNDSFPIGDVILQDGDKKTLLIKDVVISSFGGPNFSIYKTDEPKIVVLQSSDGDVVSSFVDRFFLNLNTQKIVLEVETESNVMDSILITKSDGVTKLKLEGKYKDQCPNKSKTTSFIGLSLNNNLFKVTGIPVIFKCINDWPGYNGGYSLDDIKVTKDFLKVFSRFKIFKFEDNDKLDEILTKKLYIDLDTNKVGSLN